MFLFSSVAQLQHSHLQKKKTESCKVTRRSIKQRDSKIAHRSKSALWAVQWQQQLRQLISDVSPSCAITCCIPFIPEWESGRCSTCCAASAIKHAINWDPWINSPYIPGNEEWNTFDETIVLFFYFFFYSFMWICHSLFFSVQNGSRRVNHLLLWSRRWELC